MHTNKTVLPKFLQGLHFEKTIKKNPVKVKPMGSVWGRPKLRNENMTNRLTSEFPDSLQESPDNKCDIEILETLRVIETAFTNPERREFIVREGQGNETTTSIIISSVLRHYPNLPISSPTTKTLDTTTTGNGKKGGNKLSFVSIGDITFPFPLTTRRMNYPYGMITRHKKLRIYGRREPLTAAWVYEFFFYETY